MMPSNALIWASSRTAGTSTALGLSERCISAISVPSKALHQNADGELFVKVKGADGAITDQVVKIGNSHNGKTEITEGISVGDEVLLP